eukprot:15365533-Ditylum_brightwellii.AAC.3
MFLEVLTDTTTEKESKYYIGANQILELGQNTLNYVQSDAIAKDITLTDKTNDENMDILKDLSSSDKEEMSLENEVQRK